MLAVLIIIVVMGIGLPVALGLIARWRKSVPAKPHRVYGEVSKWLLSEYGLGTRDRSAVQQAVLGRYAAVTVLDQSPGWPAAQAPSSLRPELQDAAHGLAARLAADRFRGLRVARRLGWMQLAMAALAAVYGVLALAGGWGSNPFLGGYAVLEAALFAPAGTYNALIIPRRRRRAARNYLAAAAPARPGSPPASASRPDQHGAPANGVEHGPAR